MKELGIRDRRILAELDKNCKISYNGLARKLRVSPSVVERKVKNLIKNGYILTFKSIINYRKLGWTYYSAYARFQNITDEKKNEMIEYLKNHDLSGQVLLCDGRWQLVYGFFARDIFEATRCFSDFTNKYGQWLNETNRIIHTGSHHYFRGHFLNQKVARESEPFLGGPEQLIGIDSKLIKLLNYLRDKARINMIDLAKETGLSVDQLRYKMKKLTKDKLLLGAWLSINPAKFNLNHYRVLLKLKNFDTRTENKLLTFVNGDKNVVRANSVFGAWDYLIDLEITTADFRRFIDDLVRTFPENIWEYETLMIYEEVKYNFSPVFPLIDNRTDNVSKIK